MMLCFALCLSSSCQQAAEEDRTPHFDGKAWKHQEETHTYVQKNIRFMENSNAVFSVSVPEAYMKDETVNSFTKVTAPSVIVLGSEDTQAYTDAGFTAVSLYPETGCPLGAVSVKGLIRFLRCFTADIPGSMNRLWIVGNGRYGTIAASCAASGNDGTFDRYLEQYGALQTDENGRTLSDTPEGVFIGNAYLECGYADGAYEWMIGRHDPERAENELAAALASEYGAMISAMEYQDENGAILLNDPGEDGMFAEGAYTEYLLAKMREADPSLQDLRDYAETYAEKDDAVPALDRRNRDSDLNALFHGHFDATVHAVLAGMEDSQAEEWDSDLYAKDEAGITLITRMNLYEPLYFLRTVKTAERAKYWIISSSLAERKTALCSDIDLYLVLKENRTDAALLMSREACDESTVVSAILAKY